jgi:hypothetical protein
VGEQHRVDIGGSEAEFGKRDIRRMQVGDAERGGDVALPRRAQAAEADVDGDRVAVALDDDVPVRCVDRAPVEGAVDRGADGVRRGPAVLQQPDRERSDTVGYYYF